MPKFAQFFATRWGIISVGGFYRSLCPTSAEVGESGKQGFLVLMLIFPQVQAQDKSGVLFYNQKGPGSMYAPLIVSLVIDLCKGVEPDGAGYRIRISKD